MDYITAQEVADKWGMKRMRVQILWVDGCWLIYNEFKGKID